MYKIKEQYEQIRLKKPSLFFHTFYNETEQRNAFLLNHLVAEAGNEWIEISINPVLY